MARHAYVSRRDGRYLFRARLPACLKPPSKSAFRISLRTSDQRVAVRRAARIASWMMSVKAAEDPKEVFRRDTRRLRRAGLRMKRGQIGNSRLKYLEQAGVHFTIERRCHAIDIGRNRNSEMPIELVAVDLDIAGEAGRTIVVNHRRIDMID